MTARFKTFFILALMLAFTTPAAAQEVGSPQSLATTPLEIVTGEGVFVFDVEVARTREEMSKGLMFRTEMAENHGMIFHYSPPRLARIWMKNTYISLDILFINADGTILNIARNTTPFSLATISAAGSVAASLELNAGVVEAFGIESGDQVHHLLFGNFPDDEG